MAVSDISRVLRIPGQFCVNPTQLYPGTFPFGGTPIGFTRGCVLELAPISEEVIAEEIGEVFEKHQKGERVRISCILEQWDRDVFPLIFPIVTTTSPNGFQNIQRLDGGYGPRVIPAMNPLLFKPLDDRIEAILFLRPIPALDPAVALALSNDEDATFPLVFIPTRPVGKPPWQIGKMEDLAL